ncbi:unnamed protein product [Oncorhynchus mykiss]|uniref:Uncharacterized protein n=1 Tax=Oncorhynchus mykiss TaxID=8022 RepID=A0A060XFY7_ONCMY|nr:unnamed protein product [Oncorhynchus mykiss]
MCHCFGKSHLPGFLPHTTFITTSLSLSPIRPFISISDDNEEARAKHLYQQWTDLGLTDVQLSNYSVLLSLPGPSSSRIVDRASHECFLPSGAQCDPRNHNNNPTADQHFSYAAYSATGSLEAVVVDVQYGGLEDMRRARTTMNVTNQIALLKLGQAPLLYKVRIKGWASIKFNFRSISNNLRYRV